MEPKIKSEPEPEDGTENRENSPIPAPTRSLASQRMLIVSLVPTARTLLSDLLNLNRQPRILWEQSLWTSAFTACYWLCPVVDGNPQWVGSVKKHAMHSTQGFLETLEQQSIRAFSTNRTLCANICAPWLINPAVMRDGPVVDATAVARDWELFKAGVPSTYNSPHGFTYSPRNQTVFPDEYLRTWRMTFVISHPVILFPRIYGILCLAKMAAHKTRLLCGLYMTYRWLRGLYDWCQQQDGGGSQQLAPIIIEGEELRYRPLPVIPDYCATTGLPVDYHRLLINSLLAENDKNRVSDQALANAVNGLIEGGKSSLDAWIEVGKGRWVADYGQEAADMIEEFARAAEEDFVYLYANRMR